MIWQLLKRDPAWAAAFWMAPVGAAAGMFLNSNNREGALLIPLIGLYMTIARERATLFTAALPVPARHLFLARVFAILSLLWIPAATAAAVLVVLGKSLEGVGNITEAALLLTVAAFVALSLRPSEFSAPTRPLVFFAVLLAGAAFPLIDWAPAGTSTAGSALVSMLLFWCTWRAIPPSFQAAPIEARGGARRYGTAVRTPVIVWWPVLRTLFPAIAFCMWPAMLFQPGPNQWQYATLISFFSLLSGVGRSHWALSLPVARRALLGMLLGFSITPVIAGYFGSLRFANAPHSARIIALNLAACLCISFVGANGLLIAMHHRFRRLPRAVKGLCMVLATIPYVAVLADAFLHGGESVTGAINGTLQFLSDALPANLALVLATALVPAALLLWNAFRLFAGIELPGARPPSAWEVPNRA